MGSVFSVGYRRHEDGGAIRESAAGGIGGRDEPAGGGAGVWLGAQDGQQDAGVCGAARLPAAEAGAPAEAGSVARRDRRDPGGRQAALAQAAAYGERILERLRTEHGYTGGYTIVKDYVRSSKIGGQEMFIPLTHTPGEAQADFGEAMVVITGVEQKAHFMAFSLPYSDDCFVQAFPAETTEAFLEAHVRAFEYFGGANADPLRQHQACRSPDPR